MMRLPALSSIALACAVLGACTQTPLIEPAAMTAATAYKENAASHANSADQASMHMTPLPQSWWRLYQEPQLDALQQQLLDHSPDLASALARYQQAQAASNSVQAAQAPGVTTSWSTLRDRQSALRPLRGAGSPDNYNSGTLNVDVEYEVDLWGRVRQIVSAGIAQEHASLADLAAARLSLQVQLTDTWFALRGLDQQTVLLQETETAYQRAAELIERRHRNGIASGLDLARANNQLQATRSQTQQVQAQRAVLEHAIAALVGSNASTFAIAAQAMTMHLPVIPAGIPSQLLQRRPDIAAARLRVAAAGAEVGAARTAFFPTLNLSASGGLQSSDLARLFEMSNLYWAIGPSLAMTMFDGGRRQARIANAQAVLDEAGQRYRSTVLGAFQQVEDQLALLEHYRAAAASDQAAADAALRALELAGNRYRQGASSYLEVVTAQTASLQSRRSVLELHTRQQRASVQLVRALGGGWDSSQ